jgi:transcriptional regulator with XRE-family HTH domain
MAKNNEKKNIIGVLIRQKMLEAGLTARDLAKALNCDVSNVYKIFKREHIDAKVLGKLSKLLNYNFSADLYENCKRIVIIETTSCKISQLQKDKSLKIIYIQ